MCLNHKLPGVEGIYDQSTYWDEHKEALERWAAHIMKCTLTRPKDTLPIAA